VQTIAPASSDSVDDTAGGMAVFRRKVRGVDLEFVDGRLCRGVSIATAPALAPRECKVMISAIDSDAVHQRAESAEAERIVAAWTRCSPAESPASPDHWLVLLGRVSRAC
jgi:hypothetical protein